MKVGVVGHGSIGQRHAANLATLGHEVLVYDPQAIIGRVTSEREIYETCDAVVIATPSALHTIGLRAAAMRGKHILVEKPIAKSNPETVAHLLALAEASRATVMMGNNLRFHPCVKQAKQWIVEGHIGKPLWAQFTCANLSSKKTYREDGVILNIGAHEVDISLFLLGAATVLSANARCTDGHDDIADFVLEHESGCRSSFHLNHITPNEIREAWIVGEERNIGIDFLGRRTSLGSMSTGHNGSYDDDYVDELKAFFDRIDNKIAPGASGRDGLATLRVLLEVRKMAGLG